MDERARAVQFRVVQLRSFNDYRDRKTTRNDSAQWVQHMVQHVVQHLVIDKRVWHSCIVKLDEYMIADNDNSKIKN